MKTFPRPLKMLALLALLTTVPAQALQLVVWDTQLQTKLGYGESSGNKLNVHLVSDYSGPVIALFSQDDDDNDAYQALEDRYSGQLKSGVLTLEDDSGSLVSLSKFLAPFKLTPTIQNAAKSFSLPGLKSPPGK
jgi:hypothetical protein